MPHYLVEIEVQKGPITVFEKDYVVEADDMDHARDAASNLCEEEIEEEGLVDEGDYDELWVTGVALLEACDGCGGWRKSISPRGHGAVRG